jgi:hypothetical protein
MTLEIVAGYEPREAIGFSVCAHSAYRLTTKPLSIVALTEQMVRASELYTREHQNRDGQLWDVISGAPMATTFACSRFLVPWLATGHMLWCDFSDMLFLADPAELFSLAEDRYAVMVVKRTHVPTNTTKMDGQEQTTYPRKNWSSLILWNLDHPANQRLTLEMVNGLPGRDLHRFCWLEDDEIGELPVCWNHLVSVDQPAPDLKLLHYTLGIPTMPGYANAPYASEWWAEFRLIAPTMVGVAA